MLTLCSQVQVSVITTRPGWWNYSSWCLAGIIGATFTSNCRVNTGVINNADYGPVHLNDYESK